MLIRRPAGIYPSEINCEALYHGRRDFIRAAATLGVASGLAVIHFWWLVKKDITEPFIFAVLLAALLIIRLLYLLRQQRANAAAASSTVRSQAA